MNSPPTGLRWVFAIGVFLALGFQAPSLDDPNWGEKSVFAQEGNTSESTPPNTETNPSPGSSAEIPHTSFLLDYVIVLALVAVALYAVCRSSRRV